MKYFAVAVHPKTFEILTKQAQLKGMSKTKLVDEAIKNLLVNRSDDTKKQSINSRTLKLQSLKIKKKVTPENTNVVDKLIGNNL